MNSNRYSKVSKKTLRKLRGILAGMSSDIDFDLFHEVMGLVYVETHGTDSGFELLNEWVESGNSELPAGKTLWACWRSYDDYHERYFGMAGLMELAEQPNKKR